MRILKLESVQRKVSTTSPRNSGMVWSSGTRFDFFEQALSGAEDDEELSLKLIWVF
jgi:hypothetical protein